MLSRFLQKAVTTTKFISYVGGKTASTAGTTGDITVSLSGLTGGFASSPAQNDIVIASFATSSASNRTFNISGYTQIADLVALDTYDTNLFVGWKRMTATPDTSITFTGGTSSTLDAGAIAIQVFRNVNVTTALDVTSTTATATNTAIPNPPSITPVTSKSVIVAIGASAHMRGSVTFSSSDLTSFISVGRDSNNDVSLGAGYAVWTSGAFDPAAFTFDSTDGVDFSAAAVTLALRVAT